MTTDPDVLELVEILVIAGYGVVGGELLTTIALGREPILPDEERPSGDETVASYGIKEEEAAEDTGRLPIPDSEQFGYAMSFLQARLVVPALALGEAERLAGSLEDPQGRPVPIRFWPAEGEDDPPTSMRAPGDDAAARKLENILLSLPDGRGPATSEAG